MAAFDFKAVHDDVMRFKNRALLTVKVGAMPITMNARRAGIGFAWRKPRVRNSLFLLVALLMGGVIVSGHTAAAKGIDLPDRPSKSDIDLVTALEQRRTTRAYSDKTLALEDLAAILWAANGVNRTDGKRTAPSAFGRQYIDIYVAATTGVYLYDAVAHKLNAFSAQNIKGRLAQQGHVASSSHVIVLVANLGKVPGSSEETKLHWAHSTAGTIAQNIHLMAAAKGVGTGMVAGIRVDEIRQALNFSKEFVPLYVMPLGYPK